MTITIGVVPRERFSVAGRALRRLVEVTPGPFRLLVVDAGAPPRYRREMERAVAGRPGVEFLRHDDPLTPNAARNLVLREADGEFLALMDNDVLVSPGWLAALAAACREEPADVARPLQYESRGRRTALHLDTLWSRIETVDGTDGPAYRFHPRVTPLGSDVGAPRARTQTLELHCLLLRPEALRKVGLLDERLTTREHVDLALQLHAARVPVVFEPAAVVTYLSPPPVRRDERDFYRLRWDYAAAVRSHEIIAEKWKVLDFPESLGFVRRRADLVSYPRYARARLRRRLTALAARLRRR